MAMRGPRQMIVHRPLPGFEIPLVEGIFRVDSRESAPETWFVVYTDPQCEKRVSQALLARQVAHYLPRVARWKRQSLRAKHQQEPRRRITSALLTRYIFAALTPNAAGELHFGHISDIDGVHSILSDMDGPLPVPVAVIEEIARRESAGEFDDTAPREIQTRRGVTTITVPKWIDVGLRVIVKSGPLASFPGVIEEIVDSDRVKVGVMIFGRSAPMELLVDEIERVA